MTTFNISLQKKRKQPKKLDKPCIYQVEYNIVLDIKKKENSKAKEEL